MSVVNNFLEFIVRAVELGYLEDSTEPERVYYVHPNYFKDLLSDMSDHYRNVAQRRGYIRKSIGMRDVPNPDGYGRMCGHKILYIAIVGDKRFEDYPELKGDVLETDWSPLC